MLDPRLQAARDHLELGEHVRALHEALEALLAGRRTRAELAAWLVERSPALARRSAARVFESLRHVSEPELVRDADLRAYLRELEIGESFVRAEAPLIVLDEQLEFIAARVPGSIVRYHERDWLLELRFCAPASGRPFVARAPDPRGRPVEVFERRGEPWREAIVDLFEALAIDERDVAALRAEVELEELPRWSLWREDDHNNSVEIDRYRSYAKALALDRELEARGHKQSYWVEPAS